MSRRSINYKSSQYLLWAVPVSAKGCSNICYGGKGNTAMGDGRLHVTP
ncbi:MAG: hypothetical protein ILA03_02765 [Bacteroidaceae bacterium]|nr:hypothetical protein [Bacteroidaceae bacterium]